MSAWVVGCLGRSQPEVSTYVFPSVVPWIGKKRQNILRNGMERIVRACVCIRVELGKTIILSWAFDCASFMYTFVVYSALLRNWVEAMQIRAQQFGFFQTIVLNNIHSASVPWLDSEKHLVCCTGCANQSSDNKTRIDGDVYLSWILSLLENTLNEGLHI